MEEAKERQDGTFAGKAADLMALWADANLKVLQEMAGLAVSAASEGVRLLGELQASAVEAAKERQAFWNRQLGSLDDWQRDPTAWSRKAMREGIDESWKAVAFVEANAKAFARSAGTLQATAEQAAGKVQQALKGLAEGVKGLSTPISG